MPSKSARIRQQNADLDHIVEARPSGAQDLSAVGEGLTGLHSNAAPGQRPVGGR